MSSNTREFDVAYSWLNGHVDDRFWDISIVQKLEELLINIQKPVQPLPAYADSLPAERVSAEELAKKLVAKWRGQVREYPYNNEAIAAGCAVKLCANELEAILRPTHTPESGEAGR